jgi:hypothetical protein
MVGHERMNGSDVGCLFSAIAKSKSGRQTFYLLLIGIQSWCPHNGSVHNVVFAHRNPENRNLNLVGRDLIFS